MSCSIKISAPGTGSLLFGETSDLIEGVGADFVVVDLFTEQELTVNKITERRIKMVVSFFIIQNYRFIARFAKLFYEFG